MSKLRGMVLGAFLGDALALGPHWVYNMDDIKKHFGRVSDLENPMTNYHEGKTKGDFTHYGDQALMMFKYVKMNASIDPVLWYDHYHQFMNTYKGYKDHATKETLENIERGVHEGSHSSELGGYTRYPGIVYFHEKQIEQGISEVLLQTKLTHHHDVLSERVVFLAKLQYAILKGDKPSDAIEKLYKDSLEVVRGDIDCAKRVLEYPTEQAMKQIGQSCDSQYAFPAVMYFVLKYEEYFEDALIENAMGGGDSAARGMVLGGLLGAYHGEDQLPVKWLAGMRHLKDIENLMQTN